MPKAIKILGKEILNNIPSNFDKLPLKIIIEQKKVNKAEIHNNVSDLFFVISGEMIFTCNGKLINSEKHPFDQNTLLADRIRGGENYHLKTNDWLFVPVNCPHQRTILKKSRFVVIKIPN